MDIFKEALNRSMAPKNIINEIFNVDKKKKIYLSSLLLIQLIAFFLIFENNTIKLNFSPSLLNIISLIASIAGVLSVVLVANGKITNYFWGVINSLAYIYVSFDSHLYGEVYLNLFFIVVDFIGIYQWTKADLEQNGASSTEVIAREMSLIGWIGLGVAVFIGWLALSYFLARVPLLTAQLDPHPYLDALSTMVQLFAMLLMAYRFGASQWILWLIGDISEIVLWTVNFNPIMLTLWIAFTINSSYGFYMWTKKLNK